MKVLKETNVPLRNWNDVQRAVQQRVMDADVTDVKTPADISRLVKTLSSLPVPFAIVLVKPSQK